MAERYELPELAFREYFTYATLADFCRALADGRPSLCLCIIEGNT